MMLKNVVLHGEVQVNGETKNRNAVKGVRQLVRKAFEPMMISYATGICIWFSILPMIMTLPR